MHLGRRRHDTGAEAGMTERLGGVGVDGCVSDQSFGCHVEARLRDCGQPETGDVLAYRVQVHTAHPAQTHEHDIDVHAGE